MKIPFIKMQGLGNDFVVVDTVTNKDLLPLISGNLAHKIADRKFGVGCDQVLVLEDSKDQDGTIDFFYRIFNADGSEAQQCINGVRCLAEFIDSFGLSQKKELLLATSFTQTKVTLENDGQITAVIQPPIFDPKKIPFLAENKSSKYKLQIAGGEEIEIGAVSVGNPHAVLLVEDVDVAPIDYLGFNVSTHKYFPEKANVSFMQIVNCQQIKLRVYERGSGETLACGSGACASVVMGKLWGFLQSKVVVKLPGGELVINWNDLDDNLYVTGPAEQVFIGEIILAR